eukprot:13785.XXX_51695_49333_1 [CDS] Oithona nana genome sequencing.
MATKRGQDIVSVLNGLQMVAEAAAKQEWKAVDNSLKSSSVKNLPRQMNLQSGLSKVSKLSINDGQLLAKRSSLVLENSVLMSQALAVSSFENPFKNFVNLQTPTIRKRKILKREVAEMEANESVVEKDNEVEEIPQYIPNSSVTSLDLIDKVEDLSDRKKLLSVMFVKKRKFRKKAEDKVEEDPEDDVNAKGAKAPLVEDSKQDSTQERAEQLVKTAKAQKVPSTRLARVATFGGLGFSLGLGTLAEASRRALGTSKAGKNGNSKLDGSVVLTDANAERIVQTLCRVRGAALKIGQMLSIQDTALINPQVSAIFERVRQSADYMPTWQLQRVMIEEFGTGWRDKFQEFNEQPFAAASIGQVHRGVLKDGRVVAIKVQYPGVAKGIESDISNLMGILKVAKIVPEKLFIDEVITHMRIELEQECDYVREAECARLMRKFLRGYPDYYVPRVIDDLSGRQVFTQEFIRGLTIDECSNLDQDTRDNIVKSFLVLLFTELLQFRYMQTDPNWANFLYNPDTKQLGLLDFGATREYKKEFVDNYFMVLNAATNNDKEVVLEYSIKLGFLTGYESKIMMDAHVESVMVLASPFREDRVFDYGSQKTTGKIHELIKVMLEHRLCPPPQEVYSLHRKMSGLFLMANKLNAKINCYPIWNKLVEDYQRTQRKILA